MKTIEMTDAQRKAAAELARELPHAAKIKKLREEPRSFRRGAKENPPVGKRRSARRAAAVRQPANVFPPLPMVP